MAKQKRITTDMKRDDLLEEGQALEAELNIALDELSELQGALNEAQKSIADLTEENESLRKQLKEADLKVRNLEGILEQIDAQREAGAIPGQACESCRVEEAEAKLRPSARMAIRNLRKYGENGGLPYLREAERLIRAEIARLRG